MVRSFNTASDVLQSIFDAIPSWVFVVNEDCRVEHLNAAALGDLKIVGNSALKRREGSVLGCAHATESNKGCGHSDFCEQCVIRDSVKEALAGNCIVRNRSHMMLLRDQQKIAVFAMITASPFRYGNQTHVILVIEDLSDIVDLQRLIPICCVCKKIRNPTDSWTAIEQYFADHWDLSFTHSFCPECYADQLNKVGRSGDDSS